MEVPWTPGKPPAPSRCCRRDFHHTSLSQKSLQQFQTARAVTLCLRALYLCACDTAVEHPVVFPHATNWCDLISDWAMRHTFLDFFTYLWFFYSLSSYGTESPMSSNETAALLLPLCAHTYSIMLLLRQHQCRNFKESYSNTFWSK